MRVGCVWGMCREACFAGDRVLYYVCSAVQGLTQAQVRYTLGGVFVGLFLAALDQTVVATALPRISEELGGRIWYAWVTVSYLALSTLAAPIFGRLTELYARKEVLIAALGLFVGGSVLCGLVPSGLGYFWWLVAARGVQGAGGGALFTLAFTTLAWLFPPRERSRWAGLIGAVFGLAAALGPPLGGLLTEHLGWRWTFWINVPFGLLSLILIGRFMPNLPPAGRGQFDWSGTALLAIWAPAWLIGISALGPSSVVSCEVGIVLLVIGILSFVLWLRVERRVASPIFDLSYVQVRTFRYAALTGFFFGPAFLGGVTFLPLYLQGVLGQSPSESGLYLLALTMVSVGATGAVGAWVSRHGRYKPLLSGASLVLGGVFLVAATYLPDRLSSGLLIGLLVLVGLALAPLQALLSVVAQNDIPTARVGTVTSAVLFARQMGSSWGLALLNGLYSYGLAQSQGLLTKGLQWAYAGMAALSAGVIAMVLLLPDIRLRQKRVEDEVQA